MYAKTSILYAFTFTSHPVPEIIASWDPKKTLHQNYAALGLVDDVNSIVPRKLDCDADDDAVDLLVSAAAAAPPRLRGSMTDGSFFILTYFAHYICYHFFTLVDLEEMQRMPKRLKQMPRSMDLTEQQMLIDLMRKHGTDYKVSFSLLHSD
jgi:hypothetical protein